MRRAKIGDVYYVKLINGYKIFQWAYSVPEFGDYIRVFEGLYKVIPEDVAEIVAGDHSYIIAFYSSRAYRIGLVHLIDNLPVPEKYPFPEYMVRFYQDMKGNIFRIKVLNSSNINEDYNYDVGHMEELPEKFQKIKLLSSFLHPARVLHLFDIDFNLLKPEKFYPGVPGENWEELIKIYVDMVNTALDNDRRRKKERKMAREKEKNS